MAMTGSGTENDPWIVHNYSELSEAFSQVSLGNGVYIKLANDIDCNDYGTEFVWGNLSVSYSSRQVIFDLDNHTIKNVQIGVNQPMFTFSSGNQCVVKNGKIRNVFMNGSQGFCQYAGGLYTFAKLVNISISANATGTLGNPFYCGFESCAVYLEGGNSSLSVFNIPNIASAQMKNTDVLLKDAVGNMLFENTAYKNIIDSRIRGKFSSTQNNLADDGNLFNNCVVDLEYNKGYLTANSGTNTGVINTDKLPAGFNTRGMTSVNNQEIINGDALRAKGFVVVNVSA